MIEQIDHVNIVVRDLEAMTEFYCNVLGFQVTKSTTISGAWIDEVAGLPEVLADVVYLDLPAGPRLELIRYRQPMGSRLSQQSCANTIGIRHVAFRVSGMDEVIARLEQAGVLPNSPIAAVPRSEVQYAGGAQKRFVYFYDPEQNLLELCEYRI